MKKLAAAGIAVCLAVPIGIGATIARGAPEDSQCWDAYNLSGTRFLGTVTPKDLPLDDCTPGDGCKTLSNSSGRLRRLYVPLGADPSTACADVIPSTTAASSTTTSTTTSMPGTSTRFETIAPGGVLPTDLQCGERVRPMAENRPGNVAANNTRGNSNNDTFPRVTGNFIGSTDEIIQWTACKWGIDEDLVRAQVVAESYWNQSALGDFTTNANACVPGLPVGDYPAQYNGDSTHDGQCPESVGLGQVRWQYHKSAFENNNATRSSAYNLDYTYAVWRTCFEGGFGWLNNVSRGRQYTAGDAEGCLGLWFSGRWYTQAAVDYIDRVDTILSNRAWEQANFPPATPASTTGSGTDSPTTVATTSSTTSTTTKPTTTTTKPTTTTSKPTTTTSKPTTTTTEPTTTTTTTTTPPSPSPGSNQFVETFDDPSSLNRFDYGVHHAWIAESAKPGWYGDHDLDCGGADTSRVVLNPTAIDGKTYYPNMGPNVGVVYWCRQHMMTAFNTNRYAQVNVSPKQVFDDVRRVCWDQNRTDVGPRMWTQVVVVPLNTFQANGGRLDYVASRLSRNGPGAFGIHPTDGTFMIELTDGGSRAQTGQSVDSVNSANWTTTDKAKRYQVCIQDLENGNVRMEIEHNTGVQVRTLRGSIPNGPSRVIFQHDLYNPDKDSGVANGYTWHWDNLVVS